MKIIIFLISLICLVHATKAEKCPKVDVVTNIDYKMLNGIWYQIEAYKSPYEGEVKCIIDDFQFNDNGTAVVTIQGEGVTTDVEIILSYPLKPTGDAKTGNYLAEIPKADHTPALEASYQILATDYENYVVVFSCDEDDSKVEIEGWIESRTRTLSEDHLNKGRDLFVKYGLDKTQFKKVDQENCD